MKLKRILAVLMIAVVVIGLAGCNYVSRPLGAANNGEDISSVLKNLLVIPKYDYEAPPEPEIEYDYIGEELIPLPDPEPDPVLTPFTSTYDPEEHLTKIDELIKAVKAANGPANSATGVSDELLNGRSVKILVPDNFPIEEEHEAVKAMAEQYGCAVNVRRVGTGSSYVAACRKAALSGDNVDLMYVDNSIWGDIHPFTQPIQSFVDLELGDKMNTFSSSFSEKFFVQDALDSKIVNYYVAAGMGAPYLLVYNKANLKTATLEAGTAILDEGTSDEEILDLRAIKTSDPVEMYKNGTWGVNAFTTILKASTSGSNVGLASEIDRMDGLDIWFGMEDSAGFAINSTTGKARLSEEEFIPVNKGLDTVQDWYWTDKGVDGKRYIASFQPSKEYEDSTVFEKMFNNYTGSDAVKSFTFVGCDLQDLADVDHWAEATGSKYDFVAYPYGETYENTYRAMSEEEFTAAFTDGEEELATPVAGWAGGFAVMKTCQNPSVALRVAEEYVKIWKADNETPYTDLMSEEQLARYNDMKDNIGISFVRAWAEKAADVNEAYPNYAQYMYSFNFDGNPVSGGTMHTQDPDVFSTHRSYYVALALFDGDASLVTSPMYHKDKATTVYNPEVHTSWSGFMNGQVSAVVDTGKDTGSLSRILNESLAPSLILFAESK